MQYSVLVVEDDKGLRDYIKEVLIEEGFLVKATKDGVSTLKKMEEYQPEIVLLDLILPDIAGETLCTDIKKSYPDTIIIMLTAKDSASDVAEGLEKGADDYVTKPFKAEELVARIKARLRGKGENDKNIINVGDLEINTKNFEVKRGKKKIELTPQEFRLLEYLARNADQVLTREMILNRIWKGSTDVETRVVDVYIGYLRKKIDKDSNDQLIHSVRGFGYTLKTKS